MNPAMHQSYQIDTSRLVSPNSALAQDSRFLAFQGGVRGITSFNSASSFNVAAKAILAAWKSAFQKNFGTLDQQPSILAAIDQGRAGPAGLAPIKTPWGGVHITTHTPPNIEKYLAIKAGGYLHFETHAEKQEALEVHEGAGVLLYREAPNKPLRMLVLTPGVTAQFSPGQEHSIIGTEDLLVFERSTDPRGMDKDLIFIFEAE